MHTSLLIFILNVLIISSINVSCFKLNDAIKQISRVPRKIGQFLGLKESCSSKWINTNKYGLKQTLSDKLYGQQLAVDTIFEILSQYWENNLDSHYLLLCFYGGPGTGKTFTTKLLNNYIFTQKDRSYYYLFYSGAESDLNREGLTKLEEKMKQSIQDAIDECPFSVIVFDEVNSYPEGFIDSVVLPFIKDSEGTNQYPVKRPIFIFLTNIGSKDVMEKALEIDSSYNKSHSLYYYNTIVDKLMAESQDSFYSSKLVKKRYVRHFIPFLPHKKESFIKCIENAFAKYKLVGLNSNKRSSIINDILEEVTFEPSSDPLYISSGCKRLNSFILKGIKLNEMSRYNEL